jgi:hypothetical protein
VLRHFRVHFRAAAAGMPCQQPQRAGRASSCRGQAVPAAAAGRPCRQPPRADRAGSRRGPGRQPWAGPAAVGRRAPAKPLAASCGRRMRRSRSPPGTASPSDSQAEPTLPEEGGGSGVVGRVSWDYAFSPIRRTCVRGPFRRMQGPQGTDRHIRTAAALSTYARSGARARGAARGGARMGAVHYACVRSDALGFYRASYIHNALSFESQIASGICLLLRPTNGD